MALLFPQVDRVFDLGILRASLEKLAPVAPWGAAWPSRPAPQSKTPDPNPIGSRSGVWPCSPPTVLQLPPTHLWQWSSPGLAFPGVALTCAPG